MPFKSLQKPVRMIRIDKEHSLANGTIDLFLHKISTRIQFEFVMKKEISALIKKKMNICLKEK